jgi:hypothetical protein
MCSWEEIGEKWNRAQQMGWQAIQAAMEVGEELTRKRTECLKDPDGRKVFHARVRDLGIAQQQSSRLMRLALHRDLIEQEQPQSMRQALALLPKVPTKTSDKQLAVAREEVDKYEQFAKETAKKQAEILARKKVKIELDRLQNQAHEAVLAELKAVRKQLDAERRRVSELMAEADEKRQFYEDLLNKRANGHDLRQDLKILRQVAHPDRPDTSAELRTKAMESIRHIAKFLDV